MQQFLHRLSGFFFFLLGSSFFVAYVMLRNNLHADEAAFWMQVADLPLAASAMIYAGISVYRSLSGSEEPPKIFPWLITIPLVLLFVLILVMNFWTA